MPKFGESQAAHVDTSLPSNPVVAPTDLKEKGWVIEILRKREADTQFGHQMIVDFWYADDPYTPEGVKDEYTAFFSQNSPAFKQLAAVEIDPNDPLVCVILAAGRSFKLGDPDAADTNPTPPQAPVLANHAAQASAPTSRHAANAASSSAARTPSRGPRGAQAQASSMEQYNNDLPF